MSTISISRKKYREVRLPEIPDHIISAAGKKIHLQHFSREEIEQIAEAMRAEFIQHAAAMHGAPRKK